MAQTKLWQRFKGVGAILPKREIALVTIPHRDAFTVFDASQGWLSSRYKHACTATTVVEEETCEAPEK